MIYAQTHNKEWQAIQAFDTIADLRAAEEDGWRLTRLTRKEVEERLGRKFEVGALDSEGCGYTVHPSRG